MGAHVGSASVNPNEPFMPKWAEHQFQTEEHRNAEILMHRDFFDAWEALHALPNDKLHRHRAEQAAQKLVDIAQAIKRLRELPLQVGRILNG